MNERLGVYSAVAEIVSAVAIVVSLIFVGLEIRDNTSAAYAATYDQLLADQARWRMDLATSPELVDAFNEEVGRNQFNVVTLAQEAITQTYERAYFARFYGRLGDEEWRAFEQLMCSQKQRLNRLGAPRAVFSPEFWDYLQEQDC